MSNSRSLPSTPAIPLQASTIVPFVVYALEDDGLELDFFRREERRGGVRSREEVDGEVEVEEEGDRESEEGGIDV